MECLYKAGYDDIAGEIRTGVTDIQTIRWMNKSSNYDEFPNQ